MSKEIIISQRDLLFTYILICQGRQENELCLNRCQHYFADVCVLFLFNVLGDENEGGEKERGRGEERRGRV